MPPKSVIETPEAWDLRRIRIVLQAVADGSDIAGATGLSARHVAYHLQAARILGWITAGKPPAVAPSGRALLDTQAQSAAEAALMKSAVQATAVVALVVPKLFEALSIEDVTQLLAEHPNTGLSTSTARKRASTLVRWRDQLAAAVGQPLALATATRSLLSTDRILLVHVSDIHLRREDELTRLLSRVPGLAAAVAARPDAFGIGACIVVVSGDIAFSGKTTEYELANRFLDALDRHLRERFPACAIHMVLVPGNHDCDFDKHQGMRGKLIANVDPSEVDASYVEGCVAVQDAFWEFCAARHGREHRQVTGHPAMQVQELTVGNRLVRFQLVNTAWMSTLTEQQGALIIPETTIDAITTGSPSADLVLSVFHHGYNWVEANNARRFREGVERTSDVVLTGHEHVADHFSKEGSAGQNSWHVEGGVLSDSSDPDRSCFNAIVLDLAQSELQIVSFEWQAADAMYAVAREYSSSPFQRNQYRLRNEFRLTPQFAQELDDAGEPYQHPRKSPVRLSDVYVYPELKERMYEHTGVDAERIVRDVVEYVVDRQTLLLSAPEFAGKTALSRALFVDLHRRGFVPLLLDGKALDDPAARKVHAFIDERFRATYEGRLLEQYRQLEPAKRAFIVDDFHRGPLNVGAKDELAAVLAAFGEVVVIMVDETFEVAALRGNYSKQSTLWEFVHCSLMPLGHHLRYDLVRRWCALGRGNTDDPDITSRETEKKDRAVTHLIGQNFLPSYPAFVLLCLQQLELKTPDRNHLGSFGHLYEALLTRSILAGGVGSGMDLDAKQQFLSDLAYRMFRADQETLNPREFAEAFEQYSDAFHVSFPKERVEKELIASTILHSRSGRYGFRYKYAYLFFLARHIRDHLEEEEAKDVVRQLCTRVHHEPSANTLLFLCHLSKHPFVLDTLLTAARSLFTGAPPLELEHALTPLLAAPPPRALELPSQDHHANRRQAREQRDHLETEHDLVQDSEGLPKEVMDISAAFKTVQILGQVLRGFPGSIPGDRKLEIASECYSLGLRSSRALISLIVGAHEEIEEILTPVVASRRPGLRGQPEKLKKAIRSLLYDLCEGMCFGAIQHVSDAVGLQTLSRTYEEVIRKNESISFQVIDLAVRLDHFDEFPETRLEALLRVVGNKALPMSIIRRLVWRHLYLFPLPTKQIQSLCSKLDIKFTRALESSVKGRRT